MNQDSRKTPQKSFLVSKKKKRVGQREKLCRATIRHQYLILTFINKVNKWYILLLLLTRFGHLKRVVKYWCLTSAILRYRVERESGTRTGENRHRERSGTRDIGGLALFTYNCVLANCLSRKQECYLTLILRLRKPKFTPGQRLCSGSRNVK